jgi:hypothetical protein
MLDVHPAHHAASTWRDFLIHIATIVIGLCIAVGLEQTVEFFHHRHQVAETREQLRRESEENRARMVKYVQNHRWETALLRNNMLVLTALQQHPGTPPEKLPGILYWTMRRALFARAAWNTAQAGGVLMFMPKDEVQADENLYHSLEDITNINEEEWLALNETMRFHFKDADPSHFTSAQIAEEIDLLGKLMTKHYLQGNFLGYPHTLDPAFVPGPSDEDLALLEATPPTPPAGPFALTRSRVEAAGYVPGPRSPLASKH